MKMNKATQSNDHRSVQHSAFTNSNSVSCAILVGSEICRPFFNPDICTLLLRNGQRNDFLCRLDLLFPYFAQPVVETLGFDAVLRTPLRDSQSACLLCFELFRPFPLAYILIYRCDHCCVFRFHTDSSLVTQNYSNLVHWTDSDCLKWSKTVQRFAWTLYIYIPF